MLTRLVLALLFVMGGASTAWAVYAEVGAGSQRNSCAASASDSTTCAYPDNVAVDNLMIVAGTMWGSTEPTSVTVTDTLTSTWTCDTGADPGACCTWRTFICRAIAPSSGANTVTVNPSGSSNDYSFSIDEFSGAHATPADVDGGDTADTTGNNNTPSDSLTTVTADDVLIGVFSYEGSDTTMAVSGSGTQFGENESNTNNQAHHAQFRIVTTITAYTLSGTLGVNKEWSMGTWGFKPSVAAGGCTGGFKTLLGVGPC